MPLTIGFLKVGCVWKLFFQYCPRTFLRASVINITPVLVMQKAMAPHSSTLAWKILWTEEPGRLQSMGLLRVRHN